MKLIVKREGSREVDPNFQRKLDDYNHAYGSPRIKFRWNPEARKIDDERWDPRWEIWIELVDNQFSGKKERNTKDIYEDGAWWRFLQSWEMEGQFLPLDDRFFVAARLADTWSDREHYNKAFEEPDELRRKEVWNDLKNMAGGVGSYWRGWGKTLVGPASRGDWRGSQWWS